MQHNFRQHVAELGGDSKGWSKVSTGRNRGGTAPPCGATTVAKSENVDVDIF